MCDGGPLSTLFIIFIVSLVIGIPTIIIGCNDFSCSLYDKVTSNITCSKYLNTWCGNTTCTNNNCTDIGFNCSHWVTTFAYSQKSCDIDIGPYIIGTNLDIYVNKLDNGCHTGFDKMTSILPIIGTVFLSISAITLLIFTIVYCIMRDKKDHFWVCCWDWDCCDDDWDCCDLDCCCDCDDD
jgi:hypothetical protein